MSQKLTIEPVTRVEGHGKVTIQLDDNNQVKDAHFHVVEFRGFERFIQGPSGSPPVDDSRRQPRPAGRGTDVRADVQTPFECKQC